MIGLLVLSSQEVFDKKIIKRIINSSGFGTFMNFGIRIELMNLRNFGVCDYSTRRNNYEKNR
jgi:hypothetical protein